MHHCVPQATGSVGNKMSKTGQKRAVWFGMCPVLTAERLSPHDAPQNCRHDIYLEKLITLLQQEHFGQNV